MAALVKIISGEGAAAMCSIGIEIGIAVLDRGAFGHPLEEGRATRIHLQQAAAELYKSLMHIVRRNRGCDPIDVGFGQSRPHCLLGCFAESDWRSRRALQTLRPHCPPYAPRSAGKDRHR